MGTLVYSRQSLRSCIGQPVPMGHRRIGHSATSSKSIRRPKQATACDKIRDVEAASENKEIVVFMSNRASSCGECGNDLGKERLDSVGRR
jgi:hypothetical protein